MGILKPTSFEVKIHFPGFACSNIIDIKSDLKNLIVSNMKRSDFIKQSLIGGIGLPTLWKNRPNTGRITHFKPKKAAFLEEVTIANLQEKMESGELTARQIVKGYLDRIGEIDQSGPELNSLIAINPEALEIADRLDTERKAGKIRGALHGIPILIKDNIDTGDQMKTTAGSVALKNNRAAEDAFIVRQLREAGAIILGKTNLSEFANYRSTRSQSGWSSQGGQTKNAYVLDRNPSGSSSGSGAAVAANLCAVAIGTETNGSIISPSAVQSLVGIKPTVGLWSRSGIIPISQTQDTPGPMTRTVKDAAILLSACTREDQKDKATLKPKRRIQTDYSQGLKKEGLKGKRIGYDPVFLKKGHPLLLELFRKNLELLKKHEAEIIEVKDFMERLKKPGKASSKVLRYEFKTGLNDYLEKIDDKVKTLSDIIAYNRKHPEKSMPFFGQELLIASNNTKGIKEEDYQKIRDESLSSRALINETFETHKLDAFTAYSQGPSSCIDLVNGDYDTGGLGFSTPAAISGYPNITVPMGFVHHLPVGIAFMGTAYSEHELIKIAYAFEQAAQARKKPAFLAQVPF